MGLFYKASEGLFSAMHAVKRTTSSVARGTKSVALSTKDACVHAARSAKRDVVLGYQDAKLNANADAINALMEACDGDPS
jgi:hypothetical protein